MDSSDSKSCRHLIELPKSDRPQRGLNSLRYLEIRNVKRSCSMAKQAIGTYRPVSSVRNRVRIGKHVAKGFEGCAASDDTADFAVVAYFADNTRTVGSGPAKQVGA